MIFREKLRQPVRDWTRSQHLPPSGFPILVTGTPSHVVIQAKAWVSLVTSPCSSSPTFDQ